MNVILAQHELFMRGVCVTVCVCVCAPFILWSTPLQFFSFNNSCVITIVEIPAKVSTAFMSSHTCLVLGVCVCVRHDGWF